uniref:Cyanobacterial aminoacyl-tRNA synthetase CAAD domain-containing protein n=1 Tax=Oryza brachyantha TaxID=4533 RepID=J3N4F8_ORYBR
MAAGGGAGGGGGGRGARLAANAEITEFINDLKQEWDRIEDKYAVTTLAVAASLGMWSAGGVVSAIDRLPLIPGLMEAVGIGYSGWFAYRNLLFKPDRYSQPQLFYPTCPSLTDVDICLFLERSSQRVALTQNYYDELQGSFLCKG